MHPDPDTLVHFSLLWKMTTVHVATTFFRHYLELMFALKQFLIFCERPIFGNLCVFRICCFDEVLTCGRKKIAEISFFFLSGVFFSKQIKHLKVHSKDSFRKKCFYFTSLKRELEWLNDLFALNFQIG